MTNYYGMLWQGNDATVACNYFYGKYGTKADYIVAQKEPTNLPTTIEFIAQNNVQPGHLIVAVGQNKAEQIFPKSITE